MSVDVHALVGAYALNALPPDEAAAFAVHLADCVPCQLDVADLQATAARLGAAVAEEPPAGLRARVMNVVRNTRQSPPLTHQQRADAGAGEAATPLGRSTRTRHLLLSAAAVLVILGLGALALRPVLDHSATTEADNHVMAVMHAPDARTSTTDVRGGGSITVISSRTMAAAVVMGDRLPPVGRDHDYQLWLIDRAGNARSTGMLIDGSRPQHTGPMMLEGVRPGDHIALTMERDGGSARPSMPLLAMTKRT